MSLSIHDNKFVIKRRFRPGWGSECRRRSLDPSSPETFERTWAHSLRGVEGNCPSSASGPELRPDGGCNSCTTKPTRSPSDITAQGRHRWVAPRPTPSYLIPSQTSAATTGVITAHRSPRSPALPPLTPRPPALTGAAGAHPRPRRSPALPALTRAAGAHPRPRRSPALPALLASSCVGWFVQPQPALGVGRDHGRLLARVRIERELAA
jgi:hypothetical protein